MAMRDMTWRYKNQDVLDLARSAQPLHDAATLWVGDDVSVYEGGTKLQPQTVAAVRATSSEDKSFANYDSALAHLTAPQTDTDVSVPAAIWTSCSSIRSSRTDSRFSIDPRLGASRPAHGHRAALPAAGRRRARLRVPRRSRPRAARSALASRRRGCSSSSGFATSSTAPITCCFSSAW